MKIAILSLLLSSTAFAGFSDVRDSANVCSYYYNNKLATTIVDPSANSLPIKLGEIDYAVSIYPSPMYDQESNKLKIKFDKRTKIAECDFSGPNIEDAKPCLKFELIKEYIVDKNERYGVSFESKIVKNGQEINVLIHCANRVL